jgi:hypothetical protein
MANEEYKAVSVSFIEDTKKFVEWFEAWMKVPTPSSAILAQAYLNKIKDYLTDIDKKQRCSFCGELAICQKGKIVSYYNFCEKCVDKEMDLLWEISDHVTNPNGD